MDKLIPEIQRRHEAFCVDQSIIISVVNSVVPGHAYVSLPVQRYFTRRFLYTSETVVNPDTSVYTDIQNVPLQVNGTA